MGEFKHVIERLRNRMYLIQSALEALEDLESTETEESEEADVPFRVRDRRTPPNELLAGEPEPEPKPATKPPGKAKARGVKRTRGQGTNVRDAMLDALRRGPRSRMGLIIELMPHFLPKQITSMLDKLKKIGKINRDERGLYTINQ